MKKTNVAITIAAFMWLAMPVNAQFGKLKEKVSGGKSGGGGSFAELNNEKDEMGLTGEYHSLVDKRAYGLRFVKEQDGKIVNKLQYFEKKGKEPQMELSMKESYYSKNKVKLFYNWVTANANGYVEVIELEPGILAQTIQTAESANGGPATLDAKRTVKDVYAKNKESLATWDIETAQAKVDVVLTSLNSEKMEKETAEWMKSEVFAKNVNKIVFANQWYHLQKQGYPHKLSVDGKDFKTELDMAGNMNFMAFFKYPPKVKYAGQQINIEYEMNGQKVNREECRKKSAAWSNMVKILETKDFEYNQSSTRAIREYNQYQSAYVQDYAAIQCLYNNKDKFKVGGTYDLIVRIYAHRDGENGDLLAEGTVKLKYSEEAVIVFNGDPKKPELKGVWAQFDEFLNE
ncbi:MAG TPA: hypothetical protein VK177_15425 [Flavobacteriales bacterium]|nr:hypothetical protein [Flavobacteriales bacterium]